MHGSRPAGPRWIRRDTSTRRLLGLIPLLGIFAFGWALPLQAQARIATGLYTGDGSAMRSITGVGFAPAVVIIKGDLAESAVIRTSSMPTLQSKQLAQEEGLLFNRIHALQADGFSIGSNPDVNQNGVEYRWIAMQAIAGSLVAGSYTGDGTSGQTISGLGLTPGMVVLIPGNSARCRFRTSDMTAGASLPFDDVSLETGALTSLNAGGFTVGDDWQANEDGAAFHFLAIAQHPGRARFGTYIGDGASNRVIHQPGFTPQWVWAKSAESKPGAHQTTERAGSGASLNFWPEADFSGGLQQFTGQGFIIGNHERVNEPGKTYYWAAFAGGGDLADLSATLSASASVRELGEVFDLTATLHNAGPAAVTGGTLSVLVPPGLTLQDLVFDPEPVADFSTPAEILVVHDLAAGHQGQVTATYLVDGGAAERTFTASIAATSQPDPDATNDTDSLTVAVLSADLQLDLAVDDPQPAAGGTVLVTVDLTNLGPDPVADPTAELDLPAGLTAIAADPEQGVFDLQTALWQAGPLASGATCSLQVTVQVAADQAGQTLILTGTATAARNDPQPANNSASVALTPVSQPLVTIAVVPFAQVHRTLQPGALPADVLRLRLVNEGPQAELLTGIALTNPAPDGSDQAAHDALWQDVLLRTTGGEVLATGAFTGGRFTATGLNLTLGSGETVDLVLGGAAALSAPDGVQLLPTLAAGDDVAFAAPVVLQGDWPLTAPGTLTIDGMTAAQITLHPIGPEIFQLGSERNLALDVVVPSNGGHPDILTKLNVVNLGDAPSGTVLSRVEAWADDGDGQFDPVADTRIGRLHWTGGDRYELSALAVPIPAAGLRVFVTVDIAGAALGGTVRLSLPAGDDVAINVMSGNDGPIDEPVINPYTQTITATDRVIVTTAPIASRDVHPGEDRVQLLHLVARNLHAAPQTLTRLRVRNVTSGQDGATEADLDGTVAQLFLRRDGNGNGELDDPQTDPVIGAATWQDGTAVFEGLQWSLPVGTVAHLFLTASVALHAAADGDSLGAVIAGPGDVQLQDDAALVGAWPLDSGARHRVRGMVAAQVACPAVPAVSLAAGDGPVLALDLEIPGNGYLADTLQDLRLTNLGTADAQDIQSLQLWADTGDGAFDPGTDSLLGALTSIGPDWLALDLGLPVPSDGRRLFVSLSVSGTPADSATVQLAVPVNGLVMASSNDGPRDAAVSGQTALLISTAPLLSSLSFELPRSTTDMTVQATMRVVNVSGERVIDIAPEPLTITGDGVVSVVSGPSPASLELEPGEVGHFAWQLAANATGTVQVAARCSGIGAVGGLPRTSLASTSSPHLILAPASDPGLYPVTSMPFSINRGQDNLVPLILTLVNDGGQDRAEVRLEQLVLTLDDGEQNPVAPAAVLSRAVLNEGVIIYCDRQDLETSGQTLTLDLDPPVVVTSREPTTLSLRLSIRLDPEVTQLRINLQDSAALTVVDDLSGLVRDLQLLSGNWPVQSGTGNIVTQATGLEVAAVALADRTAGPGQPEVELLRLELDGLGEDSSSEVKVGAFAVALVDTAGQPLADPSTQLARLWVQGPLTVHDLHPIAGPADSLVTFQLTPPLTIPVGAPPVAVAVWGEVAAASQLGSLRLRLGGPHLVDARDGNISGAVPVHFLDAPILGPRLTVQAPPPPLQIAVEPGLPAVVAHGARNVTALALHLTHPPHASGASVRLDTLRLLSLDGDRRLQDPRLAIDQGRLSCNGEPLAASLGFRPDQIVIDLAGWLLPPGDQATFTLHLDLADSGADGFELIVTDSSLVAVDQNLETPVALVAAPGQVLPGSSGLARLQSASTEVLAGWLDRLPPLLPGDQSLCEAAHLELMNPASASAAPLELARLSVRAATPGGDEVPAGEVLARATVWIDDQLWAEIAAVSPDDSILVFAPDTALLLPAASTRTLSLRVAVRPGAAPQGLRLGLAGDDLFCRQPGASGERIVVRAASGQSFPFWTAAAGLAAVDLASSYINFPNPFAAGRDQTSFAFSLPRAGQVSLRLWSPRGEPVCTLLRDRALPAGLHQDVTWDGRNGRGQVVLNGVYLAELVVQYDDGGRERLLRKVAVVR